MKIKCIDCAKCRHSDATSAYIRRLLEIEMGNLVESQEVVDFVNAVSRLEFLDIPEDALIQFKKILVDATSEVPVRFGVCHAPREKGVGDFNLSVVLVDSERDCPAATMLLHTKK